VSFLTAIIVLEFSRRMLRPATFDNTKDEMSTLVQRQGRRLTFWSLEPAPKIERNFGPKLRLFGTQASTSYWRPLVKALSRPGARSTWCIPSAMLSRSLCPAYIETHPAAPTVKQHLAAIRMLFDFLGTRQIVPMNPAASVRGPSIS
jgi:hypothetical protein